MTELAPAAELAHWQELTATPRERPLQFPKLYGVLLSEVEKILVALGKPHDAWRLVTFHPYTGSRQWGWGLDAETVLGSDTDSSAWAAAKIASALHCAAGVEADIRRAAQKKKAAAQRVEIDLHQLKAAEILEANPEVEISALAQVIADDCQRAGRPCRFETVRGHLKQLKPRRRHVVTR